MFLQQQFIQFFDVLHPSSSSRCSKNWFREREDMNRLSPSSPASTKSHALLIASFFLRIHNAQAGIQTGFHMLRVEQLKSIKKMGQESHWGSLKSPARWRPPI